MRKLPLLFIILAFVSSCGSKTVNKEAGDDMEAEFDSPASNSETKKTAAKRKELEDIPAPVAKKIENADYKRLAEARKSRSEANIVKVASEILSKDQNDVTALNTLAVYYADTKRYGMARQILNRALKDHPQEPALYNNMGVIYLAENEPRLALESFRKAIQLKPGYRIGAGNLASIYLEHRDYTRSISPLEESYRSTRSDLSRGSDYAVQVANNYAVALMGTGENSKAEDVFEKIVSSNTRRVEPYFNYSILLVDVLKKKKDALRILSKLQLMTEDREILRTAQDLEKKAQQ